MSPRSPPRAADSLREGLDETLTVLRLALPPTLRRTFGTTNSIENMNGSVRRIARNGHQDMPSLLGALRSAAKTVASTKKVA